MKKWLIIILFLFCWNAGGVVFFKGQGKKVSKSGDVTALPKRIVSTAPNLTEILYATGLGEKIVAVSQDSEFPSEAKSKPKTGTFWNPDIEAIIAQKPELVITLGFEQQRNLADRLERLGYNTLTVNIESVRELLEAIEKIGEVTGKAEEAKKIRDDINGKLARLNSLIDDSNEIKVLYIVQSQPLRVAGRKTFINEMIELAGGVNAIASTIYQYPPVSSEQIISSGTDVVILPAMGQKNPAKMRQQALAYWSRFENLPAVRNNAVYVIDDETVSQLGPRFYQGVEKIALCLRPGLIEKLK